MCVTYRSNIKIKSPGAAEVATLVKCFSAVWVKVAQVYCPEMRSRLKMGSPLGFLCHID